MSQIVGDIFKVIGPQMQEGVKFSKKKVAQEDLNEIYQIFAKNPDRLKQMDSFLKIMGLN
jgi:hypothetical protein